MLPKLRLPKIGMPLLAKELVEQGARRRTYQVRVAYAALLFLLFCIFFNEQMSETGDDPFSILGAGRLMFVSIVSIQIGGIYLFLPAMISGAIAHEKEQRTLELLLITDLTPWEIVLQKLLGRLVPMFTFLLLALPLMAVAYSYGGVSAGDVALSAWVLVTTCVQVGAFSVMMSAYYQRSTEALSATYLYGIGLYLAVWIGAAILSIPLGFAAGPLALVPAAIALGLVPWASLWMLGEFGTGGPAVLFLIVPAVTAWVWTAVFLRRARRYLVSRAFIRSRKRKRSSLELLFSAPAWASTRWRELAKSRKDYALLPEDEPITWRELTRTRLGRPRYFATAIALVTAPPLFIVALGAAIPYRRPDDASVVTAMVYVLWFFAVLAVTIKGVDCFARERSNGTLDVLLATPMTGEQIVRQKAAITRRLAVLFTVPLLVLVFIETWWEAGSLGDHPLGPTWYLYTATLSVVVFLPAVCWVTRWIGLRFRSRTRATLLGLGAVFAWWVGPGVASRLLSSLAGRRASWPALVTLASPATVVGLTERAGEGYAFGGLFRVSPVVPIAIGLALNAGVLLLFRRLCLRNADRYLGRVPPRSGPRRCPHDAAAGGGQEKPGATGPLGRGPSAEEAERAEEAGP